MTVHYNHTTTATIAVIGTQILIHARQPIVGGFIFTNPLNPGLFSGDDRIGKLEVDEHEIIDEIFLKIEADVQKKYINEALPLLPNPTTVEGSIKIPVKSKFVVFRKENGLWHFDHLEPVFLG